MKTKKKTKWDYKLGETFLETLKKFENAPEREMEPHVREKIKKFTKENHNSEEIYDFCDHISKFPMTKISEGICVRDISAFMQAVFDVRKFYNK